MMMCLCRPEVGKGLRDALVLLDRRVEVALVRKQLLASLEQTFPRYSSTVSCHAAAWGTAMLQRGHADRQGRWQGAVSLVFLAPPLRTPRSRKGRPSTREAQ